MAGRVIFFGVLGIAAIAVILYGFYQVRLWKMAYDHEADQAQAEREYDEFISAVEDDQGSPIDDELQKHYQHNGQHNGQDDPDDPPRRARTYSYTDPDDKQTRW